MPPIRETDLPEWREQARRWRNRRPGRDPLKQSADERRLNITGKCAFYVAALDCGVETAVEGFEACCVCGYPTHSWCEGCYARVQQQPSAAFSAVCQPCDAAQLVCDLCVRAEIKYAQGRAAYNATKQVEIPDTTLREQEVIEVTGWRDPAGLFTAHPTTRLTIKQISESTGMSIEEVKRQISFPSPGWSS